MFSAVNRYFDPDYLTSGITVNILRRLYCMSSGVPVIRISDFLLCAFIEI
jgi:hypothetical protein